MGLSVYRIDTGIIGKTFGKFRKTDLPVQKTVMAGASIMLSLNDLFNYDSHYVINSQDELDRFENPLKNTWIKKNQYYIRHPKKARDRWLIEAEKFHEFIYREQLSDIISFLRANITIKQLLISSQEGIDFSAFANVPIEGLQVEGKAQVKLNTKKELIINCPDGIKISEKRKEFVWISDFQELLSVVDGFVDGEFSHTIEIDNSFNMQVKEANLIGIGASWLKSSKLKLSFSC